MDPESEVEWQDSDGEDAANIVTPVAQPAGTLEPIPFVPDTRL